MVLAAANRSVCAALLVSQFHADRLDQAAVLVVPVGRRLSPRIGLRDDAAGCVVREVGRRRLDRLASVRMANEHVGADRSNDAAEFVVLGAYRLAARSLDLDDASEGVVHLPGDVPEWVDRCRHAAERVVLGANDGSVRRGRRDDAAELVVREPRPRGGAGRCRLDRLDKPTGRLVERVRRDDAAGAFVPDKTAVIVVLEPLFGPGGVKLPDDAVPLVVLRACRPDAIWGEGVERALRVIRERKPRDVIQGGRQQVAAGVVLK